MSNGNPPTPTTPAPEPGVACEGHVADLKFFERRLTEVIAHMEPTCIRWRVVLTVVSLAVVLTSYSWITDPTLRVVTLYESLMSHPIFSVSVPALFLLFCVFGIHQRVVAPSLIARRCRDSLSYFSLSCDDNGRLIVFQNGRVFLRSGRPSQSP